MIAAVSSTVGQIAEACGGRIAAGKPGASIGSITSDSRELAKESCFIPIVGERHDGHEFIPALAEKRSIACFLTMKEGLAAIAKKHKVSSIVCDDTVKALGAIAASHRRGMKCSVVGITGTNGKTTTKELLACILGFAGSVLKNEKNYNNEIGVPFTLLNITPRHEVAVIEMGMNHSGELDRLTRIAAPDMAVITNVGQGHLEFLGDVENVALAKSEIMHGLKPGATIIVNRETECFQILEEKAKKMNLLLVTFGLEEGADYRPEKYILGEIGMELVFRGEKIFVPLYGYHNLYNVIAAIAAADRLHVEPYRIKAALEGFASIEGRSQIIDLGYILVNDTYNSNPMSLRYALISMREIYPQKRKIAVLSDMKELGGSSRYYHAECGKLVAENGFDLLCLFGEMSDAYREGALSAGMPREKVHLFTTKDDCAAFLSGMLSENDAVLVKGSRAMKMEDIVTMLTGSVK